MNIAKLLVKKKKMILDVLLNTIAYSLPVFAKQIVILPYMSRIMDIEQYGLLIAIISLLNILPHMLGLTLNNIRLIHNQTYVDKGLSGDFKILLHIGCLVDVVVVIFALIFYFDVTNIMTITGVVILSLLWLLREYFIVAFRIKLDYKGVLINNFIMLIGFFIGLLLYNIIKFWFLIYIMAYALSVIYICSKSDLHKEKAKRTPMFKKITKDYIILISSNILDTCLSNIDKLFIFPILGGAAVSIYFASTVYTKVVTMVIGPLTSVILSYVSKEKNTSLKKFNITLLIGLAIASMGYLICILFGKFILSLLYPAFVDDAIKYVYITSATSMLIVLRGFIRPFLLKFCKMKWQLIIDIIGAVVYIIIIFMFIHQFEIWAICYAVFIATLLKLVLMVVVFIFSVLKTRNEVNTNE